MEHLQKEEPFSSDPYFNIYTVVYTYLQFESEIVLNLICKGPSSHKSRMLVHQYCRSREGQGGGPCPLPYFDGIINLLNQRGQIMPTPLLLGTAPPPPCIFRPSYGPALYIKREKIWRECVQTWTSNFKQLLIWFLNYTNIMDVIRNNVLPYLKLPVCTAK